eukprot:6074688-Amphidinium_carterae.1
MAGVPSSSVPEPTVANPSTPVPTVAEHLQSPSYSPISPETVQSSGEASGSSTESSSGTPPGLTGLSPTQTFALMYN